MTTALRPTTSAHAPSRHLLAAGVITRRSGRTITITRTASGTTGTVLPKRTPGASNPPKPSAPPPVAFLTSARTPADLDDMSGWTVADFETLWNLDETTQPLPAEVLDAAWLEATTELAYMELGTQLAVQVAYELAAGGDES